MGFGGQSKYKRVVDILYGETGINKHKVSDFVQFALLTPGRLDKIGRYLLRRVNDGLKDKKKTVLVEVSVIAFNELINACHSDLALFASHVIELLKILLNDKSIELKGLGTDTFVNFAEHGGMQFELEVFVYSFIKMATNNDADVPTQHRNRVYGLRGLHSYITSTEDIDSFIAKFVTVWSKDESTNEIKLVPLILDNILKGTASASPSPAEDASSSSSSSSSSAPAASAASSSSSAAGGSSEAPAITNNETHLKISWEKASVPTLASMCLSELAARVNTITIRSLYDGVLEYFDEKNCWSTKFTSECLMTISSRLQSQLHPITVRNLLQHMDYSHMQNNFETKRHIINTIKVTTRGNIGSTIEVISSLLRHMLGTSVDQPGVEELHEAVLDCLSVLIKRLDAGQQQIDPLQYILDRLNDTDLANRKKMATATLKASESLKPLPAGDRYPTSLIDKFCKVCLDQDPGIRQTIGRAFLSVLSAGGLLANLQNINKEKGSRSSMMFNASVGNSSKSLEQVRSMIVQSCLKTNNQPENYNVLYDFITLIVTSDPLTETTQFVPVLFRLQDLLVKDLQNCKRIVRPVLSIGLGGFLLISQLLECVPLTKSLLQTHQQRAAASPSQICKFFKVDEQAATVKYRKRKNTEDDRSANVAASDLILVLKETVLESLSSIEDLSHELPLLRKLLSVDSEHGPSSHATSSSSSSSSGANAAGSSAQSQDSSSSSSAQPSSSDAKDLAGQSISKDTDPDSITDKRRKRRDISVLSLSQMTRLPITPEIPFNVMSFRTIFDLSLPQAAERPSKSLSVENKSFSDVAALIQKSSGEFHTTKNRLFQRNDDSIETPLGDLIFPSFFTNTIHF